MYITNILFINFGRLAHYNENLSFCYELEMSSTIATSLAKAGFND